MAARRTLTLSEQTLQRLESTRPLMRPATAREFGIAASEAIREYIEKRFDVVATQRTTEEFLQALLQSSNEALARHRSLLAEFLQQCDFVKFAGDSLAVTDMESLFESARGFVLETGEPPVRMIRFLQPEWFWALTVLPLVMLWRGRRGPVAAVEYSDVSLARDVARRTRSRIGGVVWLLPIIAAALMIVGLARPQRTHSRTEVTANGIDIVLGLDISGSMQALDFKVDNYRVNRIAVVKSVVSKFIDERPDDRIGLIAFAAAPYIVSPLTLDHDWLQQNLERVNVGIGDDGTAIGSAIAAAVNHLRTTTAKSKVVILLTDGVNNSGKISPLAAAEAARALGVKVYTIGVGVRGKAPIPVRDERGNIHVVMADVDVDEKTLQAVANETGGQFYRATDTDSLQKIYEQINRYEKTAQTVQKFEHVEELYRWTLFPALGLLAIGLLLQQTRFRRLP